MIFCEKCFCDKEIVSIIRGLDNTGNCSTCGKKNIYIYDTDKDIALIDFFDKLIEIYDTIELLPDNYPKADLHLLKDEISFNWNIFNKAVSSTKIYDILVQLSPGMYEEYPDVFDKPIGNSKKYDQKYLFENSILRTNTWDEFVNSLKYDNRFHTNYINTDILQTLCSYLRKPYHKGETFFRGRISPEEGYTAEEMGAPPKDKAAEGRANSAGISRLYVANDIETTIHEVKAGAFDYITVGTFELLQDITVVDLKLIDKISPFIDTLDCTQYAINKDHLNKINGEMGKSLRRSDSHLDYIPTQFIADFIKSISHEDKTTNTIIFDYDGIEYRSTMNANGFNLAAFYPDKFKCVKVETFKIDELHYKRSLIT